MPQALTAALVKIGLSKLFATIAAQVIISAATVGVSALIRDVFGPKRPKPSDGQVPSNESVGSRRRNYGIIHTSGKRTFLESRNGVLAQVVTLGTGRENTILEHRINDQVVTLDAGGFVTQASYKGAVSIHTRSGSDSQMAIGELTALFPEWTSAHRQRGCAHAAIIGRPVDAEDFSSVYNNRDPIYTQIREGVGLYDPRLDDTMIIGRDEAGEPVYGAGAVRLDDQTTWPWSDNWALVTADYFAHQDGFGGGFDWVNWENIAAEADICDEAVTTVDAEIIARWRLWGSYDLAREKRADILAEMLKAGDGFAWQDADGKFNLMCGRWEEPDLVITDDHIVSLTAVQGPEGYQSTRAVKVLYTEAEAGYREQESATIGSLETDDDGEPQVVEAFFAPHHNQAGRIGKLALAALDADRWRLTSVLNLLGLDCVGRRFARFESAKLGLSFWVKIGVLRIDLVTLQVEGSFTQVEPGDWLFDAETEEGTPPVQAGSGGSTVSIDLVQNLSVEVISLSFGNTSGALALRASWDPPDRLGLRAEVSYRPTSGGAWFPMEIDDEGRGNSATSGSVNSGVEYEVRARNITLVGRPGDWCDPVIVTPGSLVLLDAPTSLEATGAVGRADIGLSMPTSPSVDHVKLYGSDSDDFDSAFQVGANIEAAPGTAITRAETGLSPGTRYYWARAFDAVGRPSPALAGPVLATIT